MKQKKIAIYVRVSSRENAINGYGLDAQETKCRQYIDLYDLDADSIVLFKDKGISGKSLNRPEMKKLLTEVKNDQIGMVIVYKLDRLTRSVMDTYKLIFELQKHDCQLVAVMDKLDVNSANGRMIVGLLAVFAQWERELDQERTIAAQEEMVRQGKYPYPNSPFGWDKDKNNFLSVNPYERDVINDLGNQALDGKSILEIKDYLLDNYNIKKTDETIKKYLTREINYGVFDFRGKKYEGIVPPIMSQEQSEAIVRTLRYHKISDMHKYYLHNKIECRCGTSCIHTVSHKHKNGEVIKYYYYYCPKCKKRINQKVLINHAISQIILHNNEEMLKKTEKSKVLALQKIDKVFDKTFEAFANGSIDISTYMATLTKLKKKKHTYETQLSGLKINSIEKFNKSSDMEKNTYIDSIVKKIVVDLDLKVIVQIEWK